MSAFDKAVEMGRIFPQSIEAGQHMARMTEIAVAAVAREGEPDTRCKSCAFRAGTVPNQCADTINDAIKCVVEKEPFYCHVEVGAICHGWFAACWATKERPKMEAPYPFSHKEPTP